MTTYNVKTVARSDEAAVFLSSTEPVLGHCFGFLHPQQSNFCGGEDFEGLTPRDL